MPNHKQPYDPPTKSDSLDLLKNSMDLQNFYSNYKLTDFQDIGKMSDVHPHDINKERSDYFGAVKSTDINTGNRVGLNDYFQKIDDNKYKQRELNISKLNLNAPFGLFDSRIDPNTFSSYFDKSSGDRTNIYGYDPLSVTPSDNLNDSDFIKRYNKYGASGLAESKLKKLIPGYISKKPIEKRSKSSLERGRLRDDAYNQMKDAIKSGNYKGKESTGRDLVSGKNKDWNDYLSSLSSGKNTNESLINNKQPANDLNLNVNNIKSQDQQISDKYQDSYSTTINNSRDGDKLDYYKTEYSSFYPEGIKKRINESDYQLQNNSELDNIKYKNKQRTVNTPEFAEGGNVLRGIGRGLGIAANFTGTIPGVGTVVGAGMGAVGAGLENIGTEADFKEVAADVAFGGVKGALGPLGSTAVGAVENVYDQNNISSSEQKDLWRSKYDTSYLQYNQKQEQQNNLIDGTGQIAGMFLANGGETPGTYEAEKGEVVEGRGSVAYEGGELSRNSSNAQKITGNTHGQGGVKMSGGERIYSDRLYVDSKFLKELGI